MTSFDLDMPQENATARQARLRRDDATRAREYRERLKDVGKPTSRETDEAIVEALSFVIRFAKMIDGDAYISVRSLHKAAQLILKREGKRRAHSTVLIKDRLTPRHAHNQQGWMPTTRPISAKMTHNPKEGARPWTDEDIDDLRIIIRRRAGK